jgi:hypothetical protein
MPKKSVKIYKIIRAKPLYAVLSVLALLVIVFSIVGWPVYRALNTEKITYNLPNHTIPYVDSAAATDQVHNFYQYYSNPKITPVFPTFAAYQKQMVQAYGSKNLVFYHEYYQHGFDPITCSTVLPASIDASIASTGPVANVNVYATYPDGSKATITATVVLNNEGMQVDTITCPGDKGHLPYSS